jgi:peptide/nickel transport system ATP-binding protein
MNRIILEGDIPSPANPPSGCKFHTRCSKCMGVCAAKAPRYVEVENNHYVNCHLYDKEIMEHGDEYDIKPYTPPTEQDEARENNE